MKVSIICTNYNKGTWITDAIESFLKQKTNFPFEIIIIDDASSDQSPELIKEYQERYPDKIRAFFNEENLGIARTWIKICKEAKGEFIARCDGDDYWTDDLKLQKQVDLLEQNPESRWSNSDFDFVTSNKEVIYEKAIANKIIPFVYDFETLVSYKGMTMSSTWLVDRLLMLEVNELIDPNATDDTFNIQVELFRRTRLTFLSDSTTVYRITEDSDSRPVDDERFFSRIDGLLRTQLTYINQFEDIDFKRMVNILMEIDAEQERRLHSGLMHQRNLEKNIEHQEDMIRKKNDEIATLNQIVDHVKADNEHLHQQYLAVVDSRCWRILTKVINLFRRKK